ncbi:Pentatricopeptide repeat-containing protein [Striga hermonthica]|uniref:Pentatricopeptide repeat-containing protein n=1 Tax=Striga hermonthica TaxID=68872 RepID=A0A9N7NFK7_STRHE|nr:Pentatricopeptide repeat-containing protein [Striga hermonthica]
MLADFPFPSSSLPFADLINAYTSGRAINPGRTRSLHARIIIAGAAKSPHLASKLKAFYAACKQFGHARKVFDEIPRPSGTRIWAALIGSYARHGLYPESITSFSEMRKEEKLNHDRNITLSILKACGHLCFRKTGRGLHTVVLKNGFGRDPFVSCSLVDMYSRCENVEDAKRVFDEMSEVDLVSLNTMVWGYVRNGSVHEALGLVEKTRFLFGLMPNIVTWNSLISGFSQVNDEVMVKRILESMEADGMKPDTIAFTSIISGYIQNFRTKKAYAVFRKMLRSGLTPTSLTISSLLPGTANTKDLRRGKDSRVLGFDWIERCRVCEKRPH